MTKVLRALACLFVFSCISFAQLQPMRVLKVGTYADRPGRCDAAQDVFLCQGALCKSPIYTCGASNVWTPIVPYSSTTVASTAQAASITSTALATAPDPGIYRVIAIGETTTAATSGSGCSLAATVTYTDATGSATDTVFTGLSTAALGRKNAVDYIQVVSGDVTYAATRTAGSCVGDKFDLRLVLDRVN